MDDMNSREAEVFADDEMIRKARQAELPRYMYDTPSARAALRRFADLSSGPEREGWQPIATAPDDERTVLLSVPTRWGKWNKSIPVAGRRERGLWMIFNADEAVQLVEPTHWMPLPVSPSATQREGEK